MVVWRSVVLGHALEGCSGLFVAVLLPMVVSIADNTISWLPVVVCVSFIVMEMREGSGVRVAHQQWPVGVSIVDTIAFFTFHKSQDIVLHNWALSLGSDLRSGNIRFNGITEGKNVVKSFMLKSVWINIDKTVVPRKPRVDKVLPWLAWWVDVAVCEGRLNDFTVVNILECSHLLANCVVVDFRELPSKHDFNTSLVAFFKCDFVCITKLENFLVWRPVLDFSIERTSSKLLILSQP